MKQLWCQMVDAEKESAVIEENWDDILKLALEAMESKEFRKRLSGALILADYIPNREWN